MSWVLMVLVIAQPWWLGPPPSMTSTAVRFPSEEACLKAQAVLVERWKSRSVEVRATCVEGPL